MNAHDAAQDRYLTAQANEVLGRIDVPDVRPVRLLDRATVRRLLGRHAGHHAA